MARQSGMEEEEGWARGTVGRSECPSPVPFSECRFAQQFLSEVIAPELQAMATIEQSVEPSPQAEIEPGEILNEHGEVEENNLKELSLGGELVPQRKLSLNVLVSLFHTRWDGVEPKMVLRRARKVAHDPSFGFWFTGLRT